MTLRWKLELKQVYTTQLETEKTKVRLAESEFMGEHHTILKFFSPLHSRSLFVYVCMVESWWWVSSSLVVISLKHKLHSPWTESASKSVSMLKWKKNKKVQSIKIDGNVKQLQYIEPPSIAGCPSETAPSSDVRCLFFLPSKAEAQEVFLARQRFKTSADKRPAEVASGFS